MCTIRVGGERSEFLSITLVGRSHPAANDYWDGNWIGAIVQAAAGGFRGKVRGDLRADEFVTFYRELDRLDGILPGEALFTTMEEWLSIHVTGDGHGHIELSCAIKDQPGIGNSLEFRLALDQTCLRPWIAQIGQAILDFPVIGQSRRLGRDPASEAIARGRGELGPDPAYGTSIRWNSPSSGVPPPSPRGTGAKAIWPSLVFDHRPMNAALAPVRRGEGRVRGLLVI